MADYETRIAGEGDRDFVRALNEACYRDVVIEQFGEWDDAIQEAFFTEKWAAGRFQIVRSNEKDVGALWVERRADHLIISEILIAPEFQNCGLGAAVLRELLEKASREGVTVRLQVLHRSRARRLYERLGFVISGETDTHVLMRRASA